MSVSEYWETTETVQLEASYHNYQCSHHLENCKHFLVVVTS